MQLSLAEYLINVQLVKERSEASATRANQLLGVLLNK